MVNTEGKQMENLDFGQAFKYPFNKWKRLFYILWGLIPIIGWFAIMGYQIRLVKEWTQGKFEHLPEFDLGGDLKLGFVMFIKFLPMLVAIMVASWLFGKAGNIGTLLFVVLAALTLPMLIVNFYREETVGSLFDFEKIAPVFNNLGDYIVTLIKEIALAIIFGILSIILVGIPGRAFTMNIFLADFYRRNVE